MKYKIIADSCCDLTDEMKRDMNIVLAPLTLQLINKIYIDDENLDIRQYVKDMKACPVSPKTACPSPDQFIQLYEGDEDERVFVVTISSELSGTYNSAILARNIYLEEHPKKFIHVFNTRSASVAETLIALKIEECAKAGKSDVEIIQEVETYSAGLNTFFLLEDLEHLAKAGRLNSVVAILASLLAIKPIMGATKEGTIRLVHKVRGYKKAFMKFVETVGEEGSNFANRILGIAHCNALERAEEFKEEILKRYPFKEVFIVEMQGVSSTYADDGGLVIAY